MSEEINVRDFGAKLDGLTDDTVSIQAAIEAARATKPHPPPVFIPLGTAIISDTLTTGHEIELRGLVRTGSRLIASKDFPVGKPMVSVSKSGSTPYQHQNGLFQLTLDCNGVADRGIDIFNINENGRLFDVAVMNYRHKGIWAKREENARASGDCPLNWSMDQIAIGSMPYLGTLDSFPYGENIGIHLDAGTSDRLSITNLSIGAGRKTGNLQPAYGIKMEASTASVQVQNAHFEQCQAAIYQGSGVLTTGNIHCHPSVNYAIERTGGLLTLGSVYRTSTQLIKDSSNNPSETNFNRGITFGNLETGGFLWFDEKNKVMRTKYGAIAANRQDGKVLLTGLSKVVTLDFPDTPAQSSTVLVMPFPGANEGDVVQVAPPVAAVVGNSCYRGYVSAAGQVSIRLDNNSNVSINPPRGIFKIVVIN